jgi:hypothetical protein
MGASGSGRATAVQHGATHAEGEQDDHGEGEHVIDGARLWTLERVHAG